MKIAVCDDEKVFRDELIGMLEEYSAENGMSFDISGFDDGSKLVASKNTYDIIFLDHQMDKLSGLDTIKCIREKNKDIKVVFVSSYSEIVFDSMKYNAFRFIVKPVQKDKIFEAMDAALREYNEEKKLIVKDERYNENITISQHDMIYAQADNVYTYIITASGSYRYPYNLSALESELSSGSFFRTNRSYIVNLDHVKSYDKTGLTLSNGHRAVISRSKYKEFNSVYLNHIKKGLMV